MPLISSLNLIVIFAIFRSVRSNGVTQQKLIESVKSMNSQSVSLPILRGHFLIHITASSYTGVILGGGISPSNTFNSEIWFRDDETEQWTIIPQQNQEQAPRLCYSAVAFGNELLYVYGGRETQYEYDELHTFSFTTFAWNRVQIGTPKPSARQKMTFTQNETHLIIFGGLRSMMSLNDIWALDLETLQWTQFQSKNADELDIRIGAYGCIVDNNFYIFGGEYAENTSRACWYTKLDAENENEWMSIPIVNPDSGEILFPEFIPKGSFVKSIDNDAFDGVLYGGIPEPKTPKWSMLHMTFNFTTEMVVYKKFSRRTTFTGPPNASPVISPLALIHRRAWICMVETNYYMSAQILETGVYHDSRDISTYETSVINPIPPLINPHVYTAAGRLWVFGGRDWYTGRISNFFAHMLLASSDYSWVRLPETNPPCLENAAICARDNMIWVFGGRGISSEGGDEVIKNDLWVYRLGYEDEWIRCNAKGDIPPPLVGATIVVDSMSTFILLAGGRGVEGMNRMFYGYSIKNEQWFITREDPFTGEDMQVITHPGRVCFVGGLDSSGQLREVIDFFPIDSRQKIGWPTWQTFPPEINRLNANVIPFGMGAVFFGGESFGEDALPVYRVLLGEDKIEKIEMDNSEEARKLTRIVGGGCASYDRSIYCFGGRVVGPDGKLYNNYHSQVTHIVLSEESFECLPGSGFDNDTKECYPCSDRTWCDQDTVQKCQEAPPGTFPLYSHSSRNSFPPMLPGYYFLHKDDHTLLQYCSLLEHCPIGIGTPYATPPSSGTKIIQSPQPYQLPQLPKLLSFWAMVGIPSFFALVSLTLLLIPATRRKLFIADFYSEKHDTKLDEQTNKGTKILRKTHLGGALTIVALGIVAGQVASHLIDFVYLGMDEEIETIDNIANTADTMNTNHSASVELTLIDFTGECEQSERSDQTVCNKIESDIFTNRTCSKEDSTNVFYPNTSHCRIKGRKDKFSLSQASRDKYVLQMNITGPLLSARGVRIKVETDTKVANLMGQKDETFKSEWESTFISNYDEVLTGDTMNVAVTLSPSKYVNTKNNRPEYGLMIKSIDFRKNAVGVLRNYSFPAGFRLSVTFIPGDSTLVTTHTSPSINQLVSNLSASFSLFGLLAIALVVIETLLGLKWPCGQSVRRRLEKSFVYSHDWTRNGAISMRGSCDGLSDALIVRTDVYSDDSSSPSGSVVERPSLH